MAGLRGWGAGNDFLVRRVQYSTELLGHEFVRFGEFTPKLTIFIIDFLDNIIL